MHIHTCIFLFIWDLEKEWFSVYYCFVLAHYKSLQFDFQQAILKPGRAKLFQRHTFFFSLSFAKCPLRFLRSGYWSPTLCRQTHTTSAFLAILPVLRKVQALPGGLLCICLLVMMGGLNSIRWWTCWLCSAPALAGKHIPSWPSWRSGAVRQKHPVGIKPESQTMECATLSISMPTGTRQHGGNWK